MEAFASAMPSILSALLVGALGWVCRSLVGFNKEHREVAKIAQETSGKIDALMVEHEALVESQRNQIKSQIVNIYQVACAREYITPMELDTANRLADSYFTLGGNHYIHAIVKRMNKELPLIGDPIPTD